MAVIILDVLLHFYRYGPVRSKVTSVTGQVWVFPERFRWSRVGTSSRTGAWRWNVLPAVKMSLLAGEWICSRPVSSLRDGPCVMLMVLKRLYGDLCPSCLQTSHSPKSHQADPSHSAEDWKGDRGKADDYGYMHRAGKSSPPPPFTFLWAGAQQILWDV